MNEKKHTTHIGALTVETFLNEGKEIACDLYLLERALSKRQLGTADDKRREDELGDKSSGYDNQVQRENTNYSTEEIRPYQPEAIDWMSYVRV